MRIRKSVVFGTPMVMVTALVAVLALWAWVPIGGSASGASSNAALVWNVEYWHRNADGEVLQHKKDHNAVTVEGDDAAMQALIDNTIVLAAASETSDTDTYDQIVLVVGGPPAATTPLAVGDILLLVDGGELGDNTGQDADAQHMNPADGLFAAGAALDGDGTVTLKFQAVGDPLAATQMRLVKSTPDDSAATPLAISLADTLAVINISVDLADTDTLEITWTIDVD
ncbi:MAG: hypothetical protein O7F09_05805 [Chloroflexi bacterium]|nr:hypothetical protein [Chloroflexota bacterium]